MTTQNVSGHRQMSPGWQNHPWLRSTTIIFTVWPHCLALHPEEALPSAHLLHSAILDLFNPSNSHDGALTRGSLERSPPQPPPRLHSALALLPQGEFTRISILLWARLDFHSVTFHQTCTEYLWKSCFLLYIFILVNSKIIGFALYTW